MMQRCVPVLVSCLATAGCDPSANTNRVVGQLESDRFDQYAVVGELALDGSTRTSRGALSMAIAAVEQKGLRGIVVPAANAAEAAVVDSIEVIAVASLVYIDRITSFFSLSTSPSRSRKSSLTSSLLSLVTISPASSLIARAKAVPLSSFLKLSSSCSGYRPISPSLSVVVVHGSGDKAFVAGAGCRVNGHQPGPDAVPADLDPDRAPRAALFRVRHLELDATRVGHLLGGGP